ncbi:MAG TPA: HEAT repeat domain-containing protein, partial [Planctomycetota bacterium]|nr:HEAT repeat domain-containing protein [Planctomycetota bacterium]
GSRGESGEDAAGAGACDDAAPVRAAEAGVEDLLRLLDGHAPRKYRLARRIAAIGGDDAWKGLLGRLGDPALRASIEIALGRFAPPEVIDALKRDMLRSPDAATRASIARILAARADPGDGADLRPLLARERDAAVRLAAIGGLGRLGDPASADALADLARARGREGAAALAAFLDIRSAETLEHVARRRADLCAEARLALLQASIPLASPPDAVVAAAREGLEDGDGEHRLAAIGVLSHAGDAGVEPLLDHALRGTGDELERTVRALRDLASPRAAEAGLRAIEGLPARRQERYRAGFLALLGR